MHITLIIKAAIFAIFLYIVFKLVKLLPFIVLPAMINKGNYKKGLSLVNKFIFLYPKDSRLYDMKSILLLKLGRYSEAINIIDEAIGFDPNNKMLYNSKGVILVEMKKYKQALEIFNSLINEKNILDKNKFIVKSNRGITLYKIGEVEQAKKNMYDIHIYKELENYVKPFIELIENESEKNIRKIKNENKLKIYKKYEQKDEKKFLEQLNWDPSIYFRFAYKHYSIGNYKKAIELLDKSYKLGIDFSMYSNIKALSLCALGKYNQALKLIENGIEKNPKLSGLYNTKAWILYKKGNYIQAFETLESYFREVEDNELLEQNHNVLYQDYLKYKENNK